MDTVFRTDEIGFGASADLSAVEDAAWDVMEPFVTSRRAIWIDAPKAAGVYPRNDLGSEANGAQADFRLQDRIGDRVFTPEPIRNRHAVAVVDSISGKPCWALGAGGASPNALTAANSGVLRNLPGDDAKGQSIARGFATDNDAPFWLPATGWSVAWRSRVPANAGTSNGLTFTTTGGPVIGGGDVNDTGASNLSVSVGLETSVGRLRAFNRQNNTTAGQFYDIAGDRRDDAWHDYIVIFDQSLGKFQGWIDGVAQTALTGVSNDVSATTGAEKIALFGQGLRTTNGPNLGFCGFLAGVVAFQTPVLADDAKRLAIRNLLNSR